MPQRPYTHLAQEEELIERLGKHSSCRASMCLRGLQTGHEATRAEWQAQSSARKPPGPPPWPLSPRKVQGRESPCPSQQLAKPPCPVATVENAHAVGKDPATPAELYLNPQQERSPVNSGQSSRSRCCLLLCYLVSSNNCIINGRIKPLKDQKR